MLTYKIDFKGSKYIVLSRVTDTLVWRWVYEAKFDTLKQAVKFCRLQNEAQAAA